MTTTFSILTRAKDAGVTLWVESGALRYRGDRDRVDAILPDLRAHKPEIIRTLDIVTRACNGLPLPPDRFMAEMSEADIADIEAGEIPLETLKAYAESIATRINGGLHG